MTLKRAHSAKCVRWSATRGQAGYGWPRLLGAAVLVALLFCAGASSALARVNNVIPATADGDPTETFRADEALFVYATPDLNGGTICVVSAALDDVSSGAFSCKGSRIQWGSPNFVFGGSLIFQPLEAPYLHIGTWRLLGDGGDQPGGDTVSQPFTVLPCADTCDPTLAQATVADWKSAATGMERVTGTLCTYWAVQSAASDVSGLAAKANATREAVTDDLTMILKKGAKARVIDSATATGLALDWAGGLIAIPTPDFKDSDEMALALLKTVICRASAMYGDIKADPPDPGFLTVEQPSFADIPNPDSLGHAPTPAQALATSIERQRGYGRAELKAFERYQGAVNAGAAEFVHAQALATSDFGASLVQEMRQTALLMRAEATALAADPELAQPVIPNQATLDALNTIYTRIHQSGFTQDEIAQLQGEGFTEGEIAQLRAGFAAGDLTKLQVGVSLQTVMDNAATDIENETQRFDAVEREASSVAGVTNRPPTGSFTTQAGSEPLAVSFRDASTSPDLDPITSIGWSFGDGTETSGAPGETVSHTFQAPGTYTVTETVSDYLTSAMATKTVKVGNGAPTASDQSVAVYKDGSIDVTLSASDPDGDPLTYAIVYGPEHGTVGALTGSEVTYRPDAGYFGPDFFTFKASDGRTDSNVATVAITVRENHAPIAGDDTATLDQGSNVRIAPLANDFDPDGDQLSVASLGQPGHGRAATADPAGSVRQGICYEPDADFAGDDSFTYTVDDGHGATGTATIHLTVTASDRRTLVADCTQGYYNASIGTTLDGTNDYGPFGPVMFPPAETFVGEPNFITGPAADHADLRYATRPAPDTDAGPELTAAAAPLGDWLSATSPAGGSWTALRFIPPTWTPDTESAISYPIDAGTTGIADATITGSFGADNGFYLWIDGTFEFGASAPGGAAPDEYTVKLGGLPPGKHAIQVLREDHGEHDGWFVSITGRPNRAPVAVDDTVSTEANTASEVTLRASDGEGDALQFAIVSAPQHGSLGTVSGDKVTYTPAPGYSGSDAFTFKANDGKADSNTATVAIEVRPGNHPPTAQDATVSLDQDTSKQVTLAASDPDGDTLGFAVVSAPQHGSLGTVSGDKVTYTPAPGYSGSDAFTFKANDGKVDSNLATVSIDVRHVNHAPAAQDTTATTDEDTPTQVTLRATDADGDPLTLAIASQPSHGKLGPISGDKVTYTPGPDFGGSDSFTFKASDGKLDSNVATVSITVRPVNDAPTLTLSARAAAGQYSDPITSVTATVKDVDTPPGQLTLDIDAPGPPGNLTVSSPVLDATKGTATYTLSGRLAVAAGSYPITLRASDGSAKSASQVLTVSVAKEDASIVAFSPEVITVDGTDGDVDTLVETMTVAEEPDGNLSSTLPGAGLAGARPIALHLVPPFSGTSYGCTATNTAYPAASATQASASCALSDVLVNVYGADATIGTNAYFAGSGSGVVTVVNPAADFTTGGGRAAFTDGTPVNFGFNAKTLKSNQVQGSLLTVLHRREGVWSLKSNAFDTLQQARDASGVWSATMTGKATLAAPIKLPCGQPKCGGYGFTAYVEDRAEPGAGQDRFWIQVTDPAGKIVAEASLAAPAATNALTILGGNIQVAQPQGR
jgi:hypothetical protein